LRSDEKRRPRLYTGKGEEKEERIPIGYTGFSLYFSHEESFKFSVIFVQIKLIKKFSAIQCNTK
jgi:hypothetical protein